MSQVVWKLQETDLARVWQIDPSLTNEELLQELSIVVDRWFGPKKVACYTDETGDQIIVTSVYDIRYLLKLPSVKLFIRSAQARRSSDTGWYLPSKPKKISLLDSNASIIPSAPAMKTRNFIREIVDQLDMSKVPKDREFISVSIGDPSIYSHLKPAKEVTGAVERALLSRSFNGYHPSTGMQITREALVRKFALTDHIRPELTINDVFMTCGCSQAVELSICSLMDPSNNPDNDGNNDSEQPIILLPQPGFPLYQTVCCRHSIEFDFYRLLEEDDWEMDIQYLREMMQKKNVKAILINNPSNPCGSVFSKRNLELMLEVCEEYNVTVIADEIYGGMVHSDAEFYSCASLAKGKNVPVLHLSGLAKLYLVPGWRVGWVITYDTHTKKLTQIRNALQKLSTVILGPATVIQAAVPSILTDTPKSYYDELNRTLEKQGKALTRVFRECRGLKPVPPKGAMYLMVGIDFFEMPRFKSDVEFANQLLNEEAILVLPGTIFGMPNFFRVVCCAPMNVIDELEIRFKRFCDKHSRRISAKL